MSDGVILLDRDEVLPELILHHLTQALRTLIDRVTQAWVLQNFCVDSVCHVHGAILLHRLSLHTAPSYLKALHNDITYVYLGLRVD